MYTVYSLPNLTSLCSALPYTPHFSTLQYTPHNNTHTSATLPHTFLFVQNTKSQTCNSRDIESFVGQILAFWGYIYQASTKLTKHRRVSRSQSCDWLDNIYQTSTKLTKHRRVSRSQSADWLDNIYQTSTKLTKHRRVSRSQSADWLDKISLKILS